MSALYSLLGLFTGPVRLRPARTCTDHEQEASFHAPNDSHHDDNSISTQGSARDVRVVATVTR